LTSVIIDTQGERGQALPHLGAAFQFTADARDCIMITQSRNCVMIDRSHSPPPASPEGQAIVYIIDDDPSIQEMLSSLFRSIGLRAQVFGSAAELLQSKLPDVASCLVLDVRLPGLSGLDLQAELAKADIHTPIVFMTGHGDFLTKPFRDQDLLDAVMAALDRDQKRRQYEKDVSGLRIRFESLTPRERQVMSLVTAGLMNKQAAAEVGLSEVTVKIHRGNVMKKMGAKSLADLVRMAETLALGPAKQ
jgi:FixJ family two-component response regulator